MNAIVLQATFALCLLSAGQLERADEVGRLATEPHAPPPSSSHLHARSGHTVAQVARSLPALSDAGGHTLESEYEGQTGRQVPAVGRRHAHLRLGSSPARVRARGRAHGQAS